MLFFALLNNRAAFCSKVFYAAILVVFLRTLSNASVPLNGNRGQIHSKCGQNPVDSFYNNLRRKVDGKD